MLNLSALSKKAYFACFLLYSCALFGLLTSHRLYIDDIGRSLSGYFWWSETGRPLTDAFIYLLNLGAPLVNPSPLPEFIALAILALAGTALAAQVGVISPTAVALCTLALAVQPYYLENMSYTFDSPAMALAVTLSVLAAILAIDGRKAPLTFSALCLLLVLCLYQPAMSAFFVVYLFLALKGIDSDFRPLRYLCLKGGTLLGLSVVPVGIYLPINRMLVNNKYTLMHNGVIPIRELGSRLPGNISDYFSLLLHDWRGNGLGVFMALLAFAAAATLLAETVEKGRAQSNGRGAFAVFLTLTLVVVALMPILSYFPQLLLESPVLVPRTFIGFGALLCCCALQLNSFLASRNWWGGHTQPLALAPVCLLAYMLVVFSFSFARANVAQKEFEESLLTRMVADIDSVIDHPSQINLAFIGTPGKCPLLLNTEQKFPLVGRLVPVHISDDWHWGFMQVRAMGFPFEKINLNDQERLSIIEGARPVLIRTRYCIYQVKGVTVVRFND